VLTRRGSGRRIPCREWTKGGGPAIAGFAAADSASSCRSIVPFLRRCFGRHGGAAGRVLHFDYPDPDAPTMSSATSLKLSPELKERIGRIVERSPMSAHAFMLRAIEEATERAELRQRFGTEAAEAEQETTVGARTYGLDEAFDYFEARLSGQPARRPRGKAWPKSA
jgi:predicted transcriptional regulator